MKDKTGGVAIDEFAGLRPKKCVHCKQTRV